MSFKTDAFVLRARPWREADRVYDLFTPQEGVIRAVLKSAAKPGSKLAGHLLPFSKVRVMIGRGKLDHMAGVKTLKDYANVRNDLRNLSLASSIAELFLHDQSTDQKFKEFELIEGVLDLIDNADIESDKKSMLVRIFLWKYLSLSGWQPQLEKCLVCGRKLEAGKYVAGRGIICNEHSSSGLAISKDLVNFLRFIIEADWLDFTDLSINKNLNKEWLRASQMFYQTVYERPSQALKLFTYG